MINILEQALSQHSITYPNKPVLADRFTRWGENARYYAKRFDNGFIFGDWSKDINEVCFDNKGSKLTPEEIRQRKLRAEAEKALAIEEREREQREAAIKASNIWQNAKPASNEHPYLKRKQALSYGLKEYNESLVIPLYDELSKLCSLQFIKPDGKKNFLSGGRIQGAFYLIGKPKDHILICEGYATGATLHQVIGEAVAITFNAGNLKAVAENIRIKYPALKLVICADNDCYKDFNTGLEKAKEAALSVNAKVCYPVFFNNIETKPTDFNDLYCLEGAEAVKRCLENKEPPAPKEWGEPVLFGEHNLPKIKAEYLPQPYKDFAACLADNTETPQSMAVLSVLATIATALQGKIIVKPKLDDDYKETLNIYTMTALPPANRKTSVLNACTKPLIEWEKHQQALLEPEIKRQRSFCESQKRIIDAKRRKLKDNNDMALINEIAELEEGLKEPDILPRLFLNDATPESLAVLIDEQKGRMAIISDEGGIIDVIAGLYNGGQANIDLLLKGWDGSYFRQKRKDRNLSLTPLLTINIVAQPQIIENMGGKGAFTGKGLLERFLYCLPESKLGYRTNDKLPIPPTVKSAYETSINDLLSIDYDEAPRILTLDNEARGEWQAFQASTELDLRPNGRLYPCIGWGGKICGQALRIAGLLHFAEYGADIPTINKATMDKALSIASCLTYHALAAFDLMQTIPEIALAKSAFNWIAAQEQPQFKKADLTTAMRKRAKVDKLNDALKELTERNLIKEAGKDGKTIYYEVNPNCLNRGL